MEVVHLLPGYIAMVIHDADLTSTDYGYVQTYTDIFENADFAFMCGRRKRRKRSVKGVRLF